MARRAPPSTRDEERCWREDKVYRIVSAAAAAMVVVASLLLTSGTAVAHERRNVGPYQFVVGWLNEPAYVGQLNSIDLRITDTRTNQPVAGLEKTLTADVSAGGLTPFPLTVTARFNTPGAYNGYVMPTVTGTYTFHVKGKIDTQDVDEKFQSGPNTFGDIEDTTVLQYPEKVPVASDLGARLDAIQSGVDQTRLIALGALALGVIAIVVAVVMSRRRA
jgi:hypothetical protein